ncbi:hypothetical protein [Deinococcus sp. Marseille-Q6407]|uniref:hypothetical protein n=1 Tax=Deinococcus sp. Marseille-Q6407 TaxID=2969223 RepID=UPI0021C13D9C|nr:hypothetical protein [Deinococcus sp. Marseille-Q6407]
MKLNSLLMAATLPLLLASCGGNEATGKLQDLVNSRDKHKVSESGGVTTYDFGNTEVASKTTMEARSKDAWRVYMDGPKLKPAAFGELKPETSNDTNTLYRITGGPFKGGLLQKSADGNQISIASQQWVEGGK